MRICNIIQRYPPAVGGSETWCQKVCQHVSGEGNDVLVLTQNINEEEEFWRDPSPENCILRLGPYSFDGKIKIRRYQRSLPIYWIHHGVYKFMDAFLGIYFYGPHSREMYTKMYAEIKMSDIVHTYTIPYPHNYVSLILSKLAGKPIVITPFFHTGHQNYEKRSFYFLMKFCDAVIVLSNYEREHLIRAGVNPEKIFVTGAGVDPKLYVQKDPNQIKKLLSEYNINDNENVVVFLGRKTDYKGVDQLISAARKILLERHNIKFLLVGPTNPWFSNLYNTLSAEEKAFIIDAGYLNHDDKIGILYRADLLCLPSKFESFGIVFLEAWICNTPVIGSDKGAQPSVIEDAGLTFAFGNTEDLAKKIMYILDNEEIANSMVANGKKMINEKYTWSKIGEKVLKVYKSLC
jgi:glycosyltransferase involved in cell wall biosynthesis